MVNHVHNERDSKVGALLKDVCRPRYGETLHQRPSFRNDWQQGFGKSYGGHMDTSYCNGSKKDFARSSLAPAGKGDRGCHHHSNNVDLSHRLSARPMGDLVHGKFHPYERSGWHLSPRIQGPGLGGHAHLGPRIQGHGPGGQTHRGNGNGNGLNWMHRYRSHSYGRSGFRLLGNSQYRGRGKKSFMHDQGKGVTKAGNIFGCSTRAGSHPDHEIATPICCSPTVSLLDVQPAHLAKSSVSECNPEHIISLMQNTLPSSPTKMGYLPSTSASLHCQSSFLLQAGPPAQGDANFPGKDTSISFKRDRAFITCRGNKRRPRSSAVRDYPEGCAKHLLAKRVSSASRNCELLIEETDLPNISKEAGSLQTFQPGHGGFFNECNDSNVNGGAGTAVNYIQVFHDIVIDDDEDDTSKLSQNHLEVSNEDTPTTTDVNEVLAVVANEVMVNSSGTENCNKGDDSPRLVQSDGGLFNENTIELKDGVEGSDVGAMIEAPCLRNSRELVLEESHVLVNYYCEAAKSPSNFNSTRDCTFHCQVFLALPAQTSSHVDRDSILRKRGRSSSVHPRGGVQAANISSKVTLGHGQSNNPVAELTSSTRLHDGDEMINMGQVLEISDNMGASMKNENLKHIVEVSKNSRALVPYQSNKSRASMKNKDPKQVPEISESAGALVPYQSNKNRTNGKHKDSGRRLIHKGNSRLKIYQDSRSLDGGLLLDSEKASPSQAVEGVSARSLVKRTLQEFESLRKMLVKSQDGVKDCIKRADLNAGGIMKRKGKWRNCGEKIVGEVPGVEVGDQFSFRMEMLIIGLHRQVQAGIDYIPASRCSNKAPVATSIVASGGYEDDKDDGNTLVYTGQGGKSKMGIQGSNQELVRGNLALSNSMQEKTPVRVIRGTPDPASPSSKVYTYDGLYDVVGLRFEYGASGYQVFHFTLIRRPGQPQVGLSFLSSLKRKGIARPHLLLDDISQGQERLPVCVVNEVDDEPAPLHFVYIVNMKYPLWYLPLMPQGCDCVGGCFDEEKCSCALKNGGELPYNDDGYIIRDKKVVFECGSSCRCSSSCQNRVSQKGLRYRLEIFKTPNRGWGVRSLNSIQSGGFICEYTGELLSDAEAEKRVENDEYLFDLGHECNPLRALDDPAMDGSNAIVPVLAEVAYTIDAKDMGNVARFINHSCSPNLYAQNVLYDSDDLRFPHVMLFAMENIPPMRELTYDYNYSLDQVRDAHGNVKSKACYCGAQDCKGRLY